VPASQPRQVAETPVTQAPKVEKPEEKISDKRISEEYGFDKLQNLSQDRTAIILGLNQLDDDAICDALEKYPAYKRDRRIIDDIRNGAYDAAHQQKPVSPAGQGQTFSYYS